MPSDDFGIIWRRLDKPGHEVARLCSVDQFRYLHGTAVFAHEGQPCRLNYKIICNQAWQTTAATIDGWIGARNLDVEITRDEQGWRANGVERNDLTGCIDLDLNFSPATNLLPIRRLNLAVGQCSEARAAWLRFPEFSIEPLMQSYRRLGLATYRYDSPGFSTQLVINAAGFVTGYPDFWEIEASRPC